MSVFQSRCPHTFIMQTTKSLQWTGTKAASKILKEDLFSRKQQDATRTDRKLHSCILHHLCMVATIFPVAASLTIFSTTRHFLAQYRKTNEKSLDIYLLHLRCKSHHQFWKTRLLTNRAYYLHHAFFFRRFVQFICDYLKHRLPFIFSSAFPSFHGAANIFLKFLAKCFLL